MHRIAKILAVLVAASPAVAEPPYYDREPPYYDTPDYEPGAWAPDDLYWPERDPYVDRHRRHDYPERWRVLDGYQNVRQGDSYIRLPRYISLSRLRIEGAHGHPVITHVEIHYDRRVARARVDRRLLRGQAVEVPVDPYLPVRAVIVHTDPRYRGGYSVWGG